MQAGKRTSSTSNTKGAAKTAATTTGSRKQTNVRGFEKGLAGGGCQLTNPQKQPNKALQKWVPLLLRWHRQKGTEKRPQSLACKGFPRANPLCPPTPFRNFWQWGATGLRVACWSWPRRPKTASRYKSRRTYPHHQNNYMQLFLFSEFIVWWLQLQLHLLNFLPNWFSRNVTVPGQNPLITTTCRNSKRIIAKITLTVTFFVCQVFKL